MPRPKKMADPPTPNLISTLDAIADSGLCSPSSDFGANPDWWQGQGRTSRQAAALLCGICPVLTECVSYARFVESAQTDMAEGLGSGSWPWRAIVIAAVDVKSNNRRSIDDLAREQGVDELWTAHGVDIGDA